MIDDKKVLAVIPAFNEEKSIERTIDDLRTNCPGCDILVVNDGSVDKTKLICQELNVNILDLPINLGLDGSVQIGYKYAYKNNYDIAVQFDADGQHIAKYIEPLISKINAGYDIAIGSRYLLKKKRMSLRSIGSTLISLAILVTTQTKISDPTSGMRAVNRKFMYEFGYRSNQGPEPDTISYQIKKNKAKICEVQVEMRNRIAGVSYLRLGRATAYMIRMMVSICIIQPFRKRVK